jgi:hypothetical protein
VTHSLIVKQRSKKTAQNTTQQEGKETPRPLVEKMKILAEIILPFDYLTYTERGMSGNFLLGRSFHLDTKRDIVVPPDS